MERLEFLYDEKAVRVYGNEYQVANAAGVDIVK